jgi:putative membrane protein
MTFTTIRRSTLALAAFAITGLAVPAFAQNVPGGANEGQRSMPTDINVTPQMFVTSAASGGLFEVQSSQLAIERSQDANIKKFAQQMIDDHTKVNQELQQVAQSGNLNVPNELSVKHKALLQTLQNAQGAQFDRAYVAAQIAAHEETIQLFQNAAKSLSNDPLGKFAQSHVDHLTEHLKMARALTGDAARTAGDREGGAMPNHGGHGQ